MLAFMLNCELRYSYLEEAGKERFTVNVEFG